MAAPEKNTRKHSPVYPPSVEIEKPRSSHTSSVGEGGSAPQADLAVASTLPQSSDNRISCHSFSQTSGHIFCTPCLPSVVLHSPALLRATTIPEGSSASVLHNLDMANKLLTVKLPGSSSDPRLLSLALNATLSMLTKLEMS